MNIANASCAADWEALVALSNGRGGALLPAVMDALSEGVAVFDSQDRLVFCNARYRDFCPGAGSGEAGAMFSDILRSMTSRGLISAAL
ncbi:MAG: PAS-domain containing protein, partial [Rhodospirillaceae bacterium]